MTPVITFDAGTLLVRGMAPAELPPEAQRIVRFDERSGCGRARACDYAPLLLELLTHRIPVEDRVRAFAPLDLGLRQPLVPREHQSRAFAAWRQAGCRGVAALPTGAGKTILAVMAIAELQRPALVLVPTIDLLAQWSAVLGKFFGVDIGMLGGGEHELREITVSTYDSAVLQMEFIGNRFGLLVADECHHLPGPVYRTAAAMAVAPYRLGLSATPELDEGRDEIMRDLLGEVVIRIHIDELEGKYLSNYETRQLPVELDPDELVEYRDCRRVYTDFLRANGITFKHSADWGRFLMLCARRPEGRSVLNAFFRQRRIARGTRAKTRLIREIIARHAGERIIVFTADNASAYTLGREFALPVITHHTKGGERRELLDGFRAGLFPVLVTSKVLNEGVDVPEAGVGVVLSGSGSIREHVQRLGRILRPAPGKQRAVLYELVSAGTSEEGVSARRREHRAYQGRLRRGKAEDGTPC